MITKKKVQKEKEKEKEKKITNIKTITNKNSNLKYISNLEHSQKLQKLQKLQKSKTNKQSIPNMNINTNTELEDYTLLKFYKKDQWVYDKYNEKDDDSIYKDKLNKEKKNKKPTQTQPIKRCMCINYKNVNDFQTYDRCTKQSISNSDFCELHQECKSYLRNFLSGYEPEYQPKTWSDPYIEGSHNCYSYFLNRQVRAIKDKCNEICEKKYKDSCPQKDSECSDLKPQPGDYELIKRTGSDKLKKRIYKCPHMQKKILKDNPTLIPTDFNAKCPANYYKGAMAVDYENTYHFYRANNDGTYSHKPGISKISNKDASGNLIYVPHFADRNYEEDDNNDEALNYNNFCGYYCIPVNTLVHKNLA